MPYPVILGGDHAMGVDRENDRLIAENCELRAELARLTNAIWRIDGINDYPANYSPAINAICDAILRPHLEPKP